jgi:pimeloyl-ACP methyl ester carboxylesterase
VNTHHEFSEQPGYGEKQSVAAGPDSSATLPIGFTRRNAAVNGTQLSYIIGGEGSPILLLHGWPQTSWSWRHVLQPLAANGYTVIAADLRGLGRSARAEGGYEKDNQAEDMRELLHSLALGRQVRIVGHDIGGMVAFSYARLHPAEVDRLILIELAVPGFGLEKAMDVARGGRWHFGLFMAPEVPELLFEGHERLFFEWWFSHLSADHSPFTPDAIDLVTRAYSGREALRCGFAHYRTLLADGAVNRAWGDGGGRLNMPVLAIGGEFAVKLSLADSMRPVASNLESAVIEGSGHFVPEERPDALIEGLSMFLK